MKQVIDIKKPQSAPIVTFSYFEMSQKPGVYKSTSNEGTFISVEDGVIGIQGKNIFILDKEIWDNDKFVLSDESVNLSFSN